MERGIIAADLVGGNGGGEGDAFEYWFFIIDFVEFFIDEVVSPEAKLKDFASDSNLFE